MSQPVPHPKHVALVLSPALGDSLLLMIVACNLAANGIAVTVFGKVGVQLGEWFPGIDLQPALVESELDARLAAFDRVIQMHGDKPVRDLAHRHGGAMLLDTLYRARSPEPMADRLVRFCYDGLALRTVRKANGMTPPAGLRHRQHLNRVAIHPTASTADKCWLPARFVQLALTLRARGFDPQFVVAPEERAHWQYVEPLGIALPDLGGLSNVAAWLYECGWFIGNDSGIGHLASCLQIPTLSLFMRRGIARTWRPGWGAGRVLTGSAYLPTGRMRERYWKYMLSVKRVAAAFDKLQESVS